jgi:hypothetical protein
VRLADHFGGLDGTDSTDIILDSIAERTQVPAWHPRFAVAQAADRWQRGLDALRRLKYVLHPSTRARAGVTAQYYRRKFAPTESDELRALLAHYGAPEASVREVAPFWWRIEPT